MRAKKCHAKKNSKRYITRYFNAEWEEEPSLVNRGNAADVMIELALWLRSRLEDEDANVICLSVYHAYPFFTVEEENPLGQTEK